MCALPSTLMIGAQRARSSPVQPAMGSTEDNQWKFRINVLNPERERPSAFQTLSLWLCHALVGLRDLMLGTML